MPPNLLFFFTDQQRWDTVGAYGQRLPVTPELDRMAAEGILFETAVTAHPVCGPARAALQTGRPAVSLGCFRNDVGLPPGAKTMADHLGALGYATGYIGKYHLASNFSFAKTEAVPPGQEKRDHRTGPIPPDRRGGYLDFWVASDLLEFTSHGYGGRMFDAQGRPREWPETVYRVDALTDVALEFLANREGGRPFFLFLSFIEPHHQNDRGRIEGPEGSKERWRDFDVPGDLVSAEGSWREEFPDYLGCCNALDRALGRLRARLAETGQAEETLVVFTSDHGCHFRTRNDEYKRSCHEASIRVPLVLRGPGFRGGRRIAEVVSLLDLAPTLIEAGGGGRPPEMTGRPLQDLVEGRPPPWPDEALIQISESQVGRALRTRRWKYSICAPGINGWRFASSQTYVEEFLYDLEADPHERTNLVHDPSLAAVRADLRARLLRRIMEAGEVPPEIRPARSR